MSEFTIYFADGNIAEQFNRDATPMEEVPYQTILYINPHNSRILCYFGARTPIRNQFYADYYSDSEGVSLTEFYRDLEEKLSNEKGWKFFDDVSANSRHRPFVAIPMLDPPSVSSIVGNDLVDSNTIQHLSQNDVKQHVNNIDTDDRIRLSVPNYEIGMAIAKRLNEKDSPQSSIAITRQSQFEEDADVVIIPQHRGDVKLIDERIMENCLLDILYNEILNSIGDVLDRDISDFEKFSIFTSLSELLAYKRQGEPVEFQINQPSVARIAGDVESALDKLGVNMLPETFDEIIDYLNRLSENIVDYLKIEFDSMVDDYIDGVEHSDTLSKFERLSRIRTAISILEDDPSIERHKLSDENLISLYDFMDKTQEQKELRSEVEEDLKSALSTLRDAESEICDEIREEFLTEAKLNFEKMARHCENPLECSHELREAIQRLKKIVNNPLKKPDSFKNQWHDSCISNVYSKFNKIYNRVYDDSLFGVISRLESFVEELVQTLQLRAVEQKFIHFKSLIDAIALDWQLGVNATYNRLHHCSIVLNPEQSSGRDFPVSDAFSDSRVVELESGLQHIQNEATYVTVEQRRWELYDYVVELLDILGPWIVAESVEECQSLANAIKNDPHLEPMQKYKKFASISSVFDWAFSNRQTTGELSVGSNNDRVQMLFENITRLIKMYHRTSDLEFYFNDVMDEVDQHMNTYGSLTVDSRFDQLEEILENIANSDDLTIREKKENLDAVSYTLAHCTPQRGIAVNDTDEGDEEVENFKNVLDKTCKEIELDEKLRENIEELELRVEEYEEELEEEVIDEVGELAEWVNLMGSDVVDPLRDKFSDTPVTIRFRSVIKRKRITARLGFLMLGLALGFLGGREVYAGNIQTDFIRKGVQTAGKVSTTLKENGVFILVLFTLLIIVMATLGIVYWWEKKSSLKQAIERHID